MHLIDQTLSRLTDPWGRVAVMRAWSFLHLQDGNLQQALDTSKLIYKQALACGDIYVAMQMLCMSMNVHHERNEKSLVEAVYANVPRNAELIHPFTLREALRCVVLAQAAQGWRKEAEQTTRQLLELAFEYGDGYVERGRFQDMTLGSAPCSVAGKATALVSALNTNGQELARAMTFERFCTACHLHLACSARCVWL